MDKTDDKPDDTQTPIWLTRDQVAARLGKTRPIVQKLQAKGYLHPVVKNGVSLFAVTEVDALARPGRRPAPWLAGQVRRRNTLATPPMALAAPKGRKQLTCFDCSNKA